MAETSKIEWTDATWNPITGCSVVSPGCTNCYAMRLAGTRLRHHPSRTGLTTESKAGPVWNGTVRLNEQWLSQPLRWARPRMVFVCAHGDLFHENVPDHWIDRVFAVMALSPRHTFQVLTKRSARMRRYFEEPDLAIISRIAEAGGRLMEDGDNAHDCLLATRWPLPNVWLGVSAEDQRRANERIPDLLATPAAIRFVSAEPLLGPLRFGVPANCPPHLGRPEWDFVEALTGRGYFQGPPDDNQQQDYPRLDWVICGGESGPGARPMHPAWVREMRDQCQAAGVAFFFKQWGAWSEDIGPHAIDTSDPVATIDCDGDQIVLRASGSTNSTWHSDEADAVIMRRVGKVRAGRNLDGRTWDEMPLGGRF